MALEEAGREYLNRLRAERNGEAEDWLPPAHLDEPPPDDELEPSTWEPVDLTLWLNGTIQLPEPTLGLSRSDGLRLLYPGREHAVLGETESGKTWFALACVAAELTRGSHVVYIHYEEGSPTSTIERLRLLDVDPALISGRLRFVAPSRPVRIEWVEPLLTPEPVLVVHDGVNEAMSLIGADIMAADGAAAFRRRLITPFLRVGAATLACDHFPKDREGGSRDAYGSVHKGNALDGARIVLETAAPFGRNMRGAAHLFVTKDRPGRLRARGRPTKLPGKTFLGTLAVDDATEGPDFMLKFFAPRAEAEADKSAPLADAVFGVIDALPGKAVRSLRALYAEMRKAGEQLRDATVRAAVDDLVAAGRLTETPGARGAVGYRVTPTVAQDLDP